jgi:hypothetical protein
MRGPTNILVVGSVNGVVGGFAVTDRGLRDFSAADLPGDVVEGVLNRRHRFLNSEDTACRRDGCARAEILNIADINGPKPRQLFARLRSKLHDVLSKQRLKRELKRQLAG